MTSKKIRVSREFDSWMKRIKLQFKNEFGKTLSDPEITFIICKCFPHPQYLLDVDMLKDLDLNRKIKGKLRSQDRRCKVSDMNKFNRIDYMRIKKRDTACVYCGFDGELEIEHIVPISRGGSHECSNIVLACRKCNASKHNYDVFTWCAEKGYKVPDIVIELLSKQNSQSELIL